MNKFPSIKSMNRLGFEPMSDDEHYKAQGTYSRYQNMAGVESTFYGKMFKGKRIIYFNTDFAKDHIFVEIQEDGGTRKVFHGGIKNEQDLITILKFIY